MTHRLTFNPGDVVSTSIDKYECRFCGKVTERQPANLRPFVLGHLLCLFNEIKSGKAELEFGLKWYKDGIVIPEAIEFRKMR